MLMKQRLKILYNIVYIILRLLLILCMFCVCFVIVVDDANVYVFNCDFSGFIGWKWQEFTLFQDSKLNYFLEDSPLTGYPILVYFHTVCFHLINNNFFI